MRQIESMEKTSLEKRIKPKVRQFRRQFTDWDDLWKERFLDCEPAEPLEEFLIHSCQAMYRAGWEDAMRYKQKRTPRSKE
jgi:hypothetical protein